jgi:peptide chain release factor 1
LDYSALIAKRRDRFHELEEAVGDPELFADPKRATGLLREHRRLQQTLELWDRHEDARRQLADNQELAKSDDPEFAAMAAAEIPGLEATIRQLAEDLQYALLPADPNEDRNALIEIRAGAGGDEAGLFAADLFRLYNRYAERQRWKTSILSRNESGIGGFKEIIFQVTGQGAYSKLKYESGVHRVQRVPQTESSGRIHTSTATVAVLPEVDEVEVKIDPNEVRVDVYRSTGPGGQSVNTTDSAVRLTHIPSGLVVSCQDEKSQLQNKERAFRILRARLYDIMQAEQNAKLAAERRGQVGTGDRAQKVRTYNFPQGRVTDHRVGLTSHRMEAILQGELDEFTEALQAQHRAEQLAAATI